MVKWFTASPDGGVYPFFFFFKKRKILTTSGKMDCKNAGTSRSKKITIHLLYWHPS